MTESSRARPVSVWDTGRESLRNQLRRRYVAATRTDAAALPPVLARHLIQTYTTPGGVVLDPDAHAGVVPTEALRAGRHGVGAHHDGRWRRVCTANLDRARADATTGTVTLLDGLDDPNAARLPGAIDLVLTALRPCPDSDPTRLMAALAYTLDTVADWVWPGGHIVITCQPWHRHGRLVDLPGQTRRIADGIGLLPVDHCVALTGPIRGQHVHARATGHPSPPRGNGRGCTPLAVPVHIDVLVFRVTTHTPSASPRHAAPGPIRICQQTPTALSILRCPADDLGAAA
ncbi:MAG: DNA modification methylase [Pseudonocardiales bacterium]|nr:MAG: DNA modification methylase [Pseudonocardiales bacterium]